MTRAKEVCEHFFCFILVEDQPLGLHMYWNTLKMSLCIAGLGSETRYKQCMRWVGASPFQFTTARI